MDRQAGFLAKRFDKLGRRVRLAQSGHVLNGEDVGAHRLELPRELHVVVQVILRPARIEDVARVADRRFANRAGLDRGFHCHAHVGRPVERVEDAEDVHPRGGRLANALADDVVGIIRISHRARRSQQHLEQDVRNPLAKLLEPLPGRLFEKPHRGVECRAAPHFEREQPRAVVAHKRRRSPTSRRSAHELPAATDGRRAWSYPSTAAASAREPSAQNFSTPSFLNLSRVPSGSGAEVSNVGTCAGIRRVAHGASLTLAWPLTITSPMYCSSLVARSRRGVNSNSSGVSSMNRVVQLPARNVGSWTRRDQETECSS